MNKLFIYFWKIVFRGHISNKETGDRKVIHLHGWRTATVEDKDGKRELVTPCFSILGYQFD